ncbi:hypothetical protein M0R45_010262 [Rubus argutus]|uniref:Enoyl reductase (ER) domain-containing protein n=1 Tax=Rubus argutus TaxID=59490 RepID=A0AAW1Y7G1_RUBAR
MEAKLMHAVQYDSYGGGTSERRGAASLPCKFPFIPALDVAGEIVKVGKGVKRFKAGDKVVAVLSFLIGGGLAEYAVASQSLTASRPPEVLAAEGAGLPSCGLTAHQAVTQAAGIKLDKTGQLKNVLITGATGGIGHYAVQLAKLGNTHVTATCGARNIEIVKSLGADEVLDYKTPDGAALKSPSDTHLFQEEAGTIFVNPKGDNLDYLVKLMKEGKLKTVIDSKHPLSKAEDAWAKGIDGPCTGKIIVEQ